MARSPVPSAIKVKNIASSLDLHILKFQFCPFNTYVTLGKELGLYFCKMGIVKVSAFRIIGRIKCDKFYKVLSMEIGA